MDRRRFFRSAAAALGGATALAGCRDDDAPTAAPAVPDASYIPFRGPHQAGITAAGQTTGLMAAFNVVTDDRREVTETFRALTDEIERLMGGVPYEDRDPAYPPLYTGTVGNPSPPANLTTVVSVGASLFDDRFGLADRRPHDLVEMPFLTNDRLDPARSHGDVLLSIASIHEDHDLFALRQLMRSTRGTLVLKWMIDGFNRRTAAEPGHAGVRNLMGFVDGTANLDQSRADVMERFVWVGARDGEPAWCTNGTYHALRVIRMLVEFWDRTRLSEQERLIGRIKATGAPLDGVVETDVPDFAADPDGEITRLDAHIRLANPRDGESAEQLFLRKGFNFSQGFDDAGQLDQGLAFVSFQRSLERQFLPVIGRLDGEPLEEYLVPEGGGFFFALPGAGPGEHLGEALFA